MALNPETNRGPWAYLGLVILVLAGVFLLAWLSLRTMIRGPCSGGGGERTGCANRLHQIYAFASVYAKKNGTFPLAEAKSPRAHESLNELIRFESEGLVSKLFVCGMSDDRPAAADADGRYVLD